MDFEISSLVIIPPIEQSVVDFVQLLNKGALRSSYFMYNQSNPLTLMVDGAPIHRYRYPNN